jgi:hypothetical protein
VFPVDVKLVEPAKTLKIGKKPVELTPDVYDRRTAYSKSPVEIPNTDYYRTAIRHGDLFAADARTAAAAGIPFVEPELAMKAAREAAIQHFNDSTAVDVGSDGKPLDSKSAYEQYDSPEPLWLADEDAAAPAQTKSSGSAPNDSKGSV